MYFQLKINRKYYFVPNYLCGITECGNILSSLVISPIFAIMLVLHVCVQQAQCEYTKRAAFFIYSYISGPASCLGGGLMYTHSLQPQPHQSMCHTLQSRKICAFKFKTPGGQIPEHPSWPKTIKAKLKKK